MKSTLVEQLFEYVGREHPRSLVGLTESRNSSAQDFDRIAERYLSWCVAARGEQGLFLAADSFARFSSDVNLAQGRYELAGRYENKSFEDCRKAVYDDAATMTDYLWGVYLSNFLWAHHLQLMHFFEQRFLARLRSDAQLIEVAPGHGGWGLWALNRLQQATLRGYDVSQTSMNIAGSLAQAAGLADRAAYQRQDAMGLRDLASPQAQACICCFLVEHLEQPAELLHGMAHMLEPGGLAFFTGALTAAQVDHIYEFRSESELVVLAEQAGFRVLETRSVAPGRLMRRAKFLPRSMALVLQKKTNEHW